MKEELQDLSVIAYVSPLSELIDMRPYSYGIVFGTVAQLAKQFGIKTQTNERFMTFSAPRSRLQLFIEKLHFAKVPYFAS